MFGVWNLKFFKNTSQQLNLYITPPPGKLPGGVQFAIVNVGDGLARPAIPQFGLANKFGTGKPNVIKLRLVKRSEKCYPVKG